VQNTIEWLKPKVSTWLAIAGESIFSTSLTPVTYTHYRIWKDKYLDDEERREKARKEGKPDPITEKHGGFFGRKKH